MLRIPVALLALAGALAAQEKTTVHVDAASDLGQWKPVYRYFGYDEPNYTYQPNGRKLIGELAALSQRPAYFRTHHLLVTGDGAPALKWGSTNVYTEDAAGRPVYDWTILDRIVDTWVKAGAKPLMEIGFMPQALSVKPEPYKLVWPRLQTDGWAQPPKDYAKWSALVAAWVRHSVERYGAAEVETWWWELWNEPDIFYWKGTPEEYNRLYSATAAAVKGVLPKARIGGPATTGPRGKKAARYLRQFLDHCMKTGAPLDFVSFHAKGSPEIVEGRVRMGMSAELADLDNGFEIVRSYPRFAELPIIVSEWDPEGCAACSSRTHPQNAYRNTPLFASYTASMFAHSLELAARRQVNLEGLLTWAFEFEGQPYFDGLRTLATNGIDKPVLNFFRMAGLMGGRRLSTVSSGAIGADEILKSGVRGKPDIGVLATAHGREAAVMLWNYHDDERAGPDASVELLVEGVGAERVRLTHYRIDGRHSNAFAAWKEMGSPQAPAPEQYATLEAAGQLGLLESPRWISVADETAIVQVRLPRHAVSLLVLNW